MTDQSDHSEIVATRQVVVGNERFELRVEQDGDGRLYATVYRDDALVMVKQGSKPPMQTPVSFPKCEGTKADLATPEGQAAVLQLQNYLEQMLREYHAHELLV